jgi:hypothetical protein
VRVSLNEEFIPAPQKVLSVFLDKPLDAVDLAPTEAATTLQPNRTEPELGCHLLSLDVNMGWLTTVTRVKEAPVWPLNRYSWHGSRSSRLYTKDCSMMRVPLQEMSPKNPLTHSYIIWPSARVQTFTALTAR